MSASIPNSHAIKRFEHQDSVWITKIGLNYRFGGAGKYPIAAKY
jgi:hypothetical protein